LRTSGGTWGIHVLGGPLFNDDKPRVYLLSSGAELFEMDILTNTISGVLGTGPLDGFGSDPAAWSGLAGPLTDCDTGFTIQ
jgi:hypothetical protein